MKLLTLWVVVALLLGACAAGSPRADDAPRPGAPPALDVSGFRVAETGVAVAGQPSPGDLTDAAARGYRTVVSFRTAAEGAGEEAHLVAATGLAYHNIPVNGSAISARHADELARILDAPEARPVLLHCASGNRVGGVWALFSARYRGLAPGAALEEGRRVGLSKAATIAAVERELGLRLE